MPFPSKAKVERLLALPTPPSSPLISLSPPFVEERLARCLAAPALLSSPLPIVPHPYASLFIPPPVDRREDIPEVELLPCKRLCLTALTSRYKVGESLTVAARPTKGHRVDYGFIGTLDDETRCQRAEEVGYGIRDVWVDPIEAVEEVTPTTLEGVNARVTKLAADQRRTLRKILCGDQDAQDRQNSIITEIACTSVGLSLVVHQELQAYRTHTQIQDHHIGLHEALTVTLVAQKCSDMVNTPTRRQLLKMFLCMYWNALREEKTFKYCPRGEIKTLEIELWNLKVKGTDVASYTLRFQELVLMCGRMFHKESDEVEK
ncbi:hypothetical protein Tco_1278992 [Tanacetum coccineum]